MSLYHDHRPQSFDEVIGQDEAITSIKRMLKKKTLPRAILFSGPSGCGKTTIARILKNRLGCSDADFMELNGADANGIDMVREIKSRMHLAPIDGKCRIWLIDECHQLTNSAQNALLKPLEDTPNHVYFFLATTTPQKIIKAVRTRCTDVVVRLLTNKELATLMEGYTGDLDEEVVEAIIERVEGSARAALVLLEQVLEVEGKEAQLELISRVDAQTQAIELARALIAPNSKWKTVAKLLKEINEDPETLRHMVLSYCTAVLLGGGKLAGRAARIIDRFETNFYDSKRAGLVLACWDLINGD